jgi:hypothetical protein
VVNISLVEGARFKGEDYCGEKSPKLYLSSHLWVSNAIILYKAMISEHQFFVK